MKIRTFLEITFKQFIFINICLLAMAKMAQLLLSYKRLRPYLGKNYQMLITSTLLSAKHLQQAILIQRAIKSAVRYTPWKSTCLNQAMVASFWCRYYKIPYVFFIGLNKNSKPSQKDAHAWLMAGPIAITGGYSLNTHQVISTYSNI